MRDDSDKRAPQPPAEPAESTREPLEPAAPHGILAHFFERATQAVAARPWLPRACALAILLALLLATAMTTLQGQLGTFAPRATSVAVATVPPTVDPAIYPGPPLTPIPTIVPGLGWVTAGPPNAQRVVFAPSEPAIAYTCGAPTLTSVAQPVPIVVDISRDSGATWLPMPTPAGGVVCNLMVNPVNADDVVLAASSWMPDRTLTPVGIYRSFDGGQTWRAWPLPPTAQPTQPFISYGWVWAGTTLFVAPFAAGEDRYKRLAASADGRPFAWVEKNGLFTGAPEESRYNGMFGTSSELYVEVYLGSPCQPMTDMCFYTMQTRDGGASWSRFRATYRGLPIEPFGPADPLVIGGHAVLFGLAFDRSAHSFEESRILLRSPDDGASWVRLPWPAGHLLVDVYRLWELPDGQIYAALYPFLNSNLLPPGVYRLAPGTSAWVFVAPDGGMMAVSRVAQGHARAIWGWAHFLSQDQPYASLAYHVP